MTATGYSARTHTVHHHYPAYAPAGCQWCAREDYRRTQEIAAYEAWHDHLDSQQADRDAIRTTYALGRLITITVGLALIVTGIVTANHTIWPLLACAAGAALIWRVLYTATLTTQEKS